MANITAGSASANASPNSSGTPHGETTARKTADARPTMNADRRASPVASTRARPSVREMSENTGAATACARKTGSVPIST